MMTAWADTPARDTGVYPPAPPHPAVVAVLAYCDQLDQLVDELNAEGTNADDEAQADAYATVADTLRERLTPWTGQ
jgi:hypothetical protein